MKINIQNLENDLLEIDEDVDIDFLDKAIKKFYPNKAQVHVVLDKFGNDYRLKVRVKTLAAYICDRCLSPYQQKFEVQQSQIFQVGGKGLPDQDDIIYLPTSTTAIDINPLLREMFILQHPIKMLCKIDCKGICPRCGADLNKEKCRCTTKAIDPRWEQLQKLIK